MFCFSFDFFPFFSPCCSDLDPEDVEFGDSRAQINPAASSFVQDEPLDSFSSSVLKRRAAAPESFYNASVVDRDSIFEDSAFSPEQFPETQEDDEDVAEASASVVSPEEEKDQSAGEEQEDDEEFGDASQPSTFLGRAEQRDLLQSQLQKLDVRSFVHFLCIQLACLPLFSVGRW